MRKKIVRNRGKDNNLNKEVYDESLKEREVSNLCKIQKLLSPYKLILR